MGVDSMVFNSTGNLNDAFGGFALFNNTDGVSNNAVGDHALFSNIHASSNTAIGDLALSNNDLTGNNVANSNTAVGASALQANVDGAGNTAVGSSALLTNTAGVTSINGSNTAVGFQALSGNFASGGVTGGGNVAVGGFDPSLPGAPLFANTTGTANTAIGQDTLIANTTGFFNTAVGATALMRNTTGDNNTAIGVQAGSSITGHDNICIGKGVTGTAGDANVIRIGDNLPLPPVSRCFIGGIFGSTTPGSAVYITAAGELSTTVSSRRFKDDIKPMDKASEAILRLKPVTFHYKSDAKKTPCFGLIAEEVAAVNPDLIMRGKEGEIYSVRYKQINAMLLNEFLKEHKTVEEQGATIARQQKQIDALTAGLQKVSGQLEASKLAPQVVNNP
jgi:Chaperone of endosialidase